ncbi:tape measure protein [Riemerella columbipharyngis]|uniref:Tape measure domain-containing protein n=1 Tax=Riemerella columbipharyngis TaxID=1071918 RepID=A0A1G7FMD9_9FLAO|nr:tape measure protein [Riemerella columbipharyngis]SDE77043.1 tape measure domain-containing protein [Riemerella columbipharyngis]
MSYSFSLFLKDYASSALMKISNSVSNFDSNLRRSQTNLQNKFDKSTKSINELNERLNVLNRQRTASTSINDIRRLKTEINKTEHELKKLENLPPKGLGERLRSIGGQMGGLIGLAGGFSIAMAGIGAVRSLFEKGVELEQTNTKFEVLLGSADNAKKMLSDLNNYANLTPYSNDAIIKNSELMLSFGIAQDKIMPNMKMLGDIAMGNEEKLGGLSLAYSQVMSTGKLMGQDLLQMINQGFNPLQVISKNTGISMGDLKKKMEEGAISADMVSEAFRLATSEGGLYYGMADKMAQTAGGKWSTFLGTLKNVVMRIGLKFAEWIKPIFDIGTAFVEKIIPFGKWVIGFLPSLSTFKIIMQGLGIVALAVGGYMLFTNAATIGWSITLGILEGVIWLVEAAQWAWNIAMSLNPIGLVIAGIIAFAGVVVLLWNKLAGFRGAILGVWEVLKGFGAMIKNYIINRLKELLSGITGIGQALIAFFSGDFKKAWSIGEKAGKNLLGFDSKQKLIEDGKNAFNSFNKGWADGHAKAVKTDNKKGTSGASTGVTQQPKSSIFASLTKTNGGTGKGEKGKGGKHRGGLGDKSKGIISGGSKQTHIVVNIGKLQDQTIIKVDSTEKGLSSLGDRVQEILLRAVNSVNQMQTA